MDIVLSIKNEAFRQKLPLAEIARRLEMTPQNFNNILKTDSIKFVFVQKIAHILNVSIDYLLGEKVTVIQHNNNANNPVLHTGNGHVTCGNSEKTDMEHIRNYQQIIDRMQNQIDYLIETNRQLIR